MLVPAELWVAAELRDATGAFAEPDPLARFALVNRAHGARPVLDLHFQSAAAFARVLDTHLEAVLRAHGEAWVLTGSGHHVPSATHQARGGVLFAAVGADLAERAERSGGTWLYAPARDKNGHYGAYRVWARA